MFNTSRVDTVADNEVCSPECSNEGCWGPLDDQCVSCRNFRLGRQCVNRCESLAGVYTSGPRECKHCHPECRNNCTGDVSSLLIMLSAIPDKHARHGSSTF